MMKKSKGITLVALVVTIIVLLILAGVSLNLIMGNEGIIGKTEVAVNETQKQIATELIDLKINSKVIDSYEENGRMPKLEELALFLSADEEVEYVELESMASAESSRFAGADEIFTKLWEYPYEFQLNEDCEIENVKPTETFASKPGNKPEPEPELPENTPETDAGTEVALKEGWATESVRYVDVDTGKEIASKQVATVYAVSDGQGNTVPIPNGFYYVGGTLDSGVVISDNEDDKNKYAGQADVTAGAVYNTDGTVVEYTEEQYKNLTDEQKKAVLMGNQFVWIPCSLSEYTKYNFGKTSASGWDTSTNSAEKTQIQKYGGFYVGRYEAGASGITFANNYTLETPKGTSSWQNANFTSSKVTDGKIATKAGQIPYFHADYATAVEMSEAMYNTDSVQSGLMTGTMWDVVMKYISTDKANYSDVKSTPWGNYNSDTSETKVSGSGIAYTAGRGRYLSVSSSTGEESDSFTVSDESHHYGIRTSGWADGARKNNIYDLAGNLWEWTQEHANYSSTTNFFMLRGGSFNSSYASSGSPVCYRYSYTASYTVTYIGFRPVLYIK